MHETAIDELEGTERLYLPSTSVMTPVLVLPGPAVYEEAPVFTSVDGNLYVTYPGGEPQFIGALTGVSIFKSVVVNEEEGTVTFTFVGENGEAGDSYVNCLSQM